MSPKGPRVTCDVLYSEETSNRRCKTGSIFNRIPHSILSNLLTLPWAVLELSCHQMKKTSDFMKEDAVRDDILLASTR